MGPEESTTEQLSVERGRLPEAEDDVAPTGRASEAPVPPKHRHPLLTMPDFGTAVGAAMLGFEEALRSQPPPEVQAAEHRPLRGLSGEGEEVTILFPGDAPDHSEDPDLRLSPAPGPVRRGDDTPANAGSGRQPRCRAAIRAARALVRRGEPPL